MGLIAEVVRGFSRTREKSKRRPPAHRRLLVESLERRTMLSINPASLVNTAAGGLIGPAVLAGSPVRRETAANLTLAAQPAISAAIDPSQSAKLTAANGASGNQFGISVAVSGEMVVIGAPLANDGRGAAYVFAEPGTGWADMTEVAELTASDGQAGDYFGGSVAISGDTIVVGAGYATVGGNAMQGAAYVFAEPGSGWGNMTQTAKLTASGGVAYDTFGVSVAISGDTVVVGAETAYSANPQGAAYVFTEPGAGWTNMTQTAKLTASAGPAYNDFGDSVAIGGNTIVVGAEEATIGVNSLQGAAYVFVEPGAGWANMTQTAKLTASDGAAYDYFGDSVAISGNTIAVGAFYATVGGNAAQGATYVFTAPASGWANMTQTAKLTASDGAADDNFGAAVAVSGNTIAVGADGATVGGNVQQGAVYVFAEPGAGWTNMTESAKLTAADGVAGDFFGISVSISGNTIVVGAIESGESSGGGGGGGGSDSGGGGGSDSGGGGGSDSGGGGDTSGGSGDTSGDNGDNGDDGDTSGDSGDDSGDSGGDSGDSGDDSGDSGDSGGDSGDSGGDSGDSGGDSGDSGGDSGDSGGDSGDSGDDFGDDFASAVVMAHSMLATPSANANLSAANNQGAAYVYTIQNTASAVPVVTGVSPATGPLAGGTAVTITGTGFTAATVLDFGANPATNLLVNATGTQITATSPAGMGGTVDITVTGPGGTSATSTADQFTYSAWTVVGKGDFTGDGKSDVLLENQSTGQITAWVTGGGALNLGTVPLNSGWTLAGTGDFNGDGKADLLWQNTNTGQMLVWTTGGGGMYLGTVPSGWTLDGIGDFTGDRKADLVWQNTSSGEVLTWTTGGGGMYLGSVPLNAGWTLAGVGDFNGDGKADLLWQNTSSGEVLVWTTGGGGMYLGTVPLNVGWTLAGVGDFNGDGKADLLWENTSSGEVLVWTTGGGGMYLGSVPLNAGWTLAGVGDFNGDGKADVLWQNQDTGVVLAWITDGSGLYLGTV